MENKLNYTLCTADLQIALISELFLAEDYCYKNEFTSAVAEMMVSAVQHPCINDTLFPALH